MKRLLILFVVLAVVFTGGAAFAEPETSTLIADGAYRSQVAQNARALVEIMARIMDGSEGFEGAPDANTAWVALGAYAGLSSGAARFTDAQMSAMYADLFAYGAFHDIADQPADQFTWDGEAYAFTPADGEPAYEFSINATDAYTDDEVFCDISTWYLTHVDYPQNFAGNATVILKPSPLTAFGAQIGGWQVGTLPAFGAASSPAQLKAQEGNTYDPANATDDRLETCWAYSTDTQGEHFLKLTADAPQSMRGVVLTPGYAKSAYAFSANRRIKQLEVELSGGTRFSFTLEDQDKSAYDGTCVLPLGGIYETDSVTLYVTESYAGSHFSDVCISEVQIF